MDSITRLLLLLCCPGWSAKLWDLDLLCGNDMLLTDDIDGHDKEQAGRCQVCLAFHPKENTRRSSKCQPDSYSWFQNDGRLGFIVWQCQTIIRQIPDWLGSLAAVKNRHKQE